MRPFRRGALLFSGLRAAGLLTNLAVSLIVARLLGPEGSGAFAVAVGVMTTSVVVCAVGVDLGLTWMVSTRRWSPRGAFLTGQLAALILGTAGALAGLALFGVASDSVLGGLSLQATVFALAAVPCAVALNYASQTLLAAERYEPAVAVPGLASIAYVAAVAVLAALYSIEGAVLGLLVGQVVGAVGGLVVGLRVLSPGDEPEPHSPKLDFRRLRAAVAFGITPYMASVLTVLTYRFDLFLLNASAPEREVGYYAVAVAVTNALWLLPTALGTVLFPRIAAMSSGVHGERDAGRTETRALRHTTVILFVGAVLLTAGLPLLLAPIYGSDFSPALAPALVLVPGAIALGFSAIFYSSLSGRGRPGFVLRGWLLTAAVAVALYLLLVPRYQAVGASAASSIAYIVNAAVGAWYLRKLSGEPVLPRLVPGGQELSDYRTLARRVGSGLRGRVLRS